MNKYLETNQRTGLSVEEVKEANAAFRSLIGQDATAESVKQAQDATTDFIRTRVRESSFRDKILTPEPITADELTKSLDNDDPLYIGEIEPDTPGGVVIPLGARTNSWYFHGKRYPMRFSRVETPRLQKDVTQLLTYDYDIRAVLADNILKDLASLKDTRFLQVINNMLSVSNPLAADDTVPATGVVQWRDMGADVSRISINDALGIMNESNYGLDPATALINLRFAKELQKFKRDEIGGDLAQEIMINGFTERQLFGVKFIITNKNWLVPDGTMYMFAPQEFMGKTKILEDVTMHMKKEAYMLSLWAYCQEASVIANIAGVVRADFTITPVWTP